MNSIILYGMLLLGGARPGTFGNGVQFLLLDTSRAMYVCTKHSRECWVWCRRRMVPPSNGVRRIERRRTTTHESGGASAKRNHRAQSGK